VRVVQLLHCFTTVTFGFFFFKLPFEHCFTHSLTHSLTHFLFLQLSLVRICHLLL
jgi:hypothetical protein